MDTVQENCIEWLKGDKMATATFPRGKYATRVSKLAEQYPDEVHICHKNKDGSIVAHIPVSYVHISRPRRLNLTEEQRRAMRERLVSNIDVTSRK